MNILSKVFRKKNILILSALALSFQLSSCFQMSTGTGTGGPQQMPRMPRDTEGPSQYPPNEPQQMPAPSQDRGASVRRVVLTNQNTILYMTVRNNQQPQYDRNGRRVSDGSYTVGWHASAQLIALQGARRFRFVRVEGLPLYGAKQTVLNPGQQIDFAVYFERLDPGIENFDLFECQDAETYQCWNLYNLYVSNPANRQSPQPQNVPPTQPTPAPGPSGRPGEVPSLPRDDKKAETPRPQDMPKMTPRGIVLTGIVRNAKTNRSITAKINFAQSPGIVAIDSVQSFQESGTYRAKLETGSIYNLTVVARGYLVLSETLDLSKTSDGQTIKRDFLLQPFEVGDKITLNNIYFEMGKADILSASYAELDKLVRLMQENPNMRIRLGGHTDIIGDPDANQELSQLRVDNVKRYLANHGIEAFRIEAVGYGSKYPIKTKGSDEERSVNRRVEFEILRT
jgi:OmpA-OmpF porin, OOP family